MNELELQKYRDSCLDSGLLVSLRDGELTPEETEQVQAHLAQCPDCAADERSLQASSREIYAFLTSLGPSSDELPETASALAAFQARLSTTGQRKQDDMVATASSDRAIRPFRVRKPRPRKRWWLAAAAAILIILFLLPNAGVLAAQFLALFQVQTFQPISINPQTFRNGLGENLQSFGEVNIAADNLTSITHPTRAQAEQELNFRLLLPGYLPSGVGQAVQFTSIDSSEGTFTFDAAKARAYLARTGQGNVVIPSQLAGATFVITLAPGVIINYGTQCQTQSQNVSGSPQSIADLGCSGGKPFYIAEIPSPVIQATGKASLEDLRNFVLSLPNLSSGVRLLLQNVNLATGVVPLPIPPQVQAQQVTTHGVQGVLVADSSLSLGAVIWQKGGIIYTIAGAISDRTQLMDSANSLH